MFFKFSYKADVFSFGAMVDEISHLPASKSIWTGQEFRWLSTIQPPSPKASKQLTPITRYHCLKSFNPQILNLKSIQNTAFCAFTSHIVLILLHTLLISQSHETPCFLSVFVPHVCLHFLNLLKLNLLSHLHMCSFTSKLCSLIPCQFNSQFRICLIISYSVKHCVQKTM